MMRQTLYSLEADKNVMLTLSTLAKVKPVCVITQVEFRNDISLKNGKINYTRGATLVFTLDTGERFGLEITNREEAFRQYQYIQYLLSQSNGKIKLEL